MDKEGHPTKPKTEAAPGADGAAPLVDKDAARPGRIAEQALDLAAYLQERQRQHAERARDLGYASDSFRELGTFYGSVPDSPLLSHTEQSLVRFKRFVEEREARFDAIKYDLPSIVYATVATSTGTATATAAGTLYDPDLSVPCPVKLPPQWPKDRVERYAAKLERLDPELARVARGVWQSFHGGSETAPRESLAVMRQLFDHFFALVAPDGRVRCSKFFSPKEGNNPNQVHRDERLRFAASLVPDRALSDLLDSQVHEVLGTYEQLNHLHKRGALERLATRETIRAMWAIMERWIDSIDPPSLVS